VEACSGVLAGLAVLDQFDEVRVGLEPVPAGLRVERPEFLQHGVEPDPVAASAGPFGKPESEADAGVHRVGGGDALADEIRRAVDHAGLDAERVEALAVTGFVVHTVAILVVVVPATGLPAEVAEQEAFGSSLSEKQSIRFEIAEAETRLHAARSMVRHAADRIDAGEEARVPVAMAKVFTANVVQDAIDLAVQCCGGNGIGKDLPLADFYASVRAFRIVDGADEVHKRVIARDTFDDIDASEVDHLTRFGG